MGGQTRRTYNVGRTDNKGKQQKGANERDYTLALIESKLPEWGPETTVPRKVWQGTSKYQNCYRLIHSQERYGEARREGVTANPKTGGLPIYCMM